MVQPLWKISSFFKNSPFTIVFPGIYPREMSTKRHRLLLYIKNVTIKKVTFYMEIKIKSSGGFLVTDLECKEL